MTEGNRIPFHNTACELANVLNECGFAHNELVEGIVHEIEHTIGMVSHNLYTVSLDKEVSMHCEHTIGMVSHNLYTVDKEVSMH